MKLQKLIITSFLLCFAITTIGCSNFERTCFQALTSSKAVVDQVAKDYNSGAIPQTKTNHDLIQKARAAQDTGADALLEYHNVANTQKTGQALTDAQSTLTAALSNLAALVKDLKALDGNANKLPDPVLPTTK